MIDNMTDDRVIIESGIVVIGNILLFAFCKIGLTSFNIFSHKFFKSAIVRVSGSCTYMLPPKVENNEIMFTCWLRSFEIVLNKLIIVAKNFIGSLGVGYFDYRFIEQE